MATPWLVRPKSVVAVTVPVPEGVIDPPVPTTFVAVLVPLVTCAKVTEPPPSP